MTELDPSTVARANGWNDPEETAVVPPRRRVRAVPYSEIRRERVEWLEEGRIPLAAVSIVAGEPGLGKSLYTVALAAKLSRIGVASLLLSAEDSRGATIRPRLDACKAASELVHAVELLDDTDGDGLGLPADVAELERLISDTRARLIVIDPVVAYLDGGIDSHRDASVRQALAPLARIAETHRCAVLAVLHVNKALGSDWYRRLSGSGGFGGAARSVLLFGRDPDDPDPERGCDRLLAHAKCNYAMLAASQRWRVEPILLPAEGSEPETTTARLKLVGDSEHGYRALLDSSSDPEERLPRDEAGEFLRVELAAGPRLTKDIERAARDAGIAPATLRRARTVLGVESRKSGFHGGWELALPKALTPAKTATSAEGWSPSRASRRQADSTPSDDSPEAEGSHVAEESAFVDDQLVAEVERLQLKFPDLAGGEAA